MDLARQLTRIRALIVHLASPRTKASVLGLMPDYPA